ncbi:hypothetical protein [Pikeienuella sp. HZG-20]|uniref:hypothetical protein n=1 Tax=Paludibacillus litoralis TaxID=3133267 RepID=UPI0030ED59D6
MEIRKPLHGYAFPDAFMTPPVIGLGDSLYNGMRSSTVSAAFAADAPPALVSRALDPSHEFRFPAYPEPLILDLEALVRDLSIFDLVTQLRRRLKDARDNALRWADGEHVVAAPHAAWDNLALAGAEIPDVIETSIADWRARAARLRPMIAATDSLRTIPAELSEIHMTLNALFLFNPNDRPELEHMRPIDLAAARKPRILLLSLGANHGLVDITLRAEPATGLSRLADWAERMAEVAALFTAFGPETERFYVSTLAPPSTAPNMMPPLNPEIPTDPLLRPDGYFPIYDNRLGAADAYSRYTAAEMREIDACVAALNVRMMEVVAGVFAAAGDDRIRFFRVDRMVKAFDGKHHPERRLTAGAPGARLEHEERVYSNFAYATNMLWPRPAFREGGLAGLDQHHPTGLGYSIYAHELLKALRADGYAVDPMAAPISELGDKLLSDPPRSYETMITLLYDHRRRRAGLSVPPTLAEMRGETLLDIAATTSASPADRAMAGDLIDVIDAVMKRRARP